MENAILQASGKEKLTMITMIVGGLVKIIVNWFLVARRDINIYGAPIGTLVSYITMTVMNYVFMCATLEEKPHPLRIFARPLISSLIMGASAWAIYGLCSKVLGAADWKRTALGMLLAVMVAVVVYVVSVVALRAITKEDMKLIPGGEKIARLLHIR